MSVQRECQCKGSEVTHTLHVAHGDDSQLCACLGDARSFMWSWAVPPQAQGATASAAHSARHALSVHGPRMGLTPGLSDIGKVGSEEKIRLYMKILIWISKNGGDWQAGQGPET